MLGDSLILVIAGVMFFAPAVLILVLPGQVWRRKLLWAVATFLPFVVVAIAGGVVGAEYFFVLGFVAIFGGWVVLWRYLRRQEAHAS